ncbi:hypothetical protein LA080_007565 [Diaporthe eres]|nr:hypothetical protein LA080_007565 [Diaporthe eres]
MIIDTLPAENSRESKMNITFEGESHAVEGGSIFTAFTSGFRYSTVDDHGVALETDGGFWSERLVNHPGLVYAMNRGLKLTARFNVRIHVAWESPAGQPTPIHVGNENNYPSAHR